MTFNLIIALQPLYYIILVILITKQFGADSHFIYLVVELVVVIVVVAVVVNYLLDGVLQLLIKQHNIIFFFS